MAYLIPEGNEHWSTFIVIGLKGNRARLASTPSCTLYIRREDNLSKIQLLNPWMIKSKAAVAS